MGEVTKLTGLAPHVLRSWEKNFPQLNPKKNSAGNRAYREHEVELIFRLKELLMEKKYTTAGVQKILRTEKETGESKIQKGISPQVRKDLTEIKMFMNELLERL